MNLTKQQSRDYFLEERKKITRTEAERGSIIIATRLLEVLAESSVRYLHSFVSAVSRCEVDTLLIRNIVQTKFSQMCWVAPRIIPGTKIMQHFVWDDATTFMPNRWGIDEPDPISSQPLATQLIDAVLVPLLAFDNQGYRVGYGGGYYDRFLAGCRPDALRIGVSFFEPIAAISDVNEWDIPLDLCLTPSTLYRWNSRF